MCVEAARTSASDLVAAETNLFRDVDVDGPDVMTSDLLGESRVVKKGSITGTGQDRLDIEDALDRIGGVSWFQLVHFCACGVFWFSQPSVLFSIFANGPCRGGGAVCTTPDGGEDGRGACCSEWDPASVAAGHGGCVVEEPEGIGVCTFAGPGPEPDGTQPYWSDCRSVSCQFNLGSEAGRGVFRELFDSSFFAGWMWAVPVWGVISDNFGRRTALWLALAALHIGQFASALSPNVWTYLVARHFTGIGAGCTSLTSFMIGTEYSPTSRSTAIKGGWSYWSLFGGIAQSFGAKALFMYLPGYNWRLLTLIMSAPLLLWTLPAYFLIAESPRWLLVKHGVAAANDALRVVAQKNGKSHMLHTFELRPPPVGSETLANTPFKEEENETQRKHDGTLDLCCHSMIRVRLVVTLVLWFSIAFSYYGLILRSVSLPVRSPSSRTISCIARFKIRLHQHGFLRVAQGDVFTNNAIGLAVELPATLAAIWLLDCLGRKKTTLALFLILGGSVAFSTLSCSFNCPCFFWTAIQVSF